MGGGKQNSIELSCIEQFTILCNSNLRVEKGFLRFFSRVIVLIVVPVTSSWFIDKFSDLQQDGIQKWYKFIDIVTFYFSIDLLELLYLRGGHLGDLQSQQVVCVVPGQDELVVPWHIHLKREKYIIQSCLQKTAQFKMAQHYWGARVQRFGWVKVQSVLRSSIWYLQVEYKSTRIVWINFLFNGISM